MRRPLTAADLPEEAARFVLEQISAGRFANIEAFITAGMNALKERDEAKPHRLDALREYAEKLEREDPEHLRSLGMSAQEYAASMSEPGRTAEECVRAGLMSAEECRYIQGCATREDLTKLGYSPAEIKRILEEQAGACGSCG